MNFAVLKASFLLLLTVGTSDASIHIYQNELFREVGNAYLLSGGSEGVAASPSATSPTQNNIRDGRSFIRYYLNSSFISYLIAVATHNGIKSVAAFYGDSVSHFVNLRSVLADLLQI